MDVYPEFHSKLPCMHQHRGSFFIPVSTAELEITYTNPLILMPFNSELHNEFNIQCKFNFY